MFPAPSFRVDQWPPTHGRIMDQIRLQSGPTETSWENNMFCAKGDTNFVLTHSYRLQRRLHIRNHLTFQSMSIAARIPKPRHPCGKCEYEDAAHDENPTGVNRPPIITNLRCFARPSRFGEGSLQNGKRTRTLRCSICRDRSVAAPLLRVPGPWARALGPGPGPWALAV